MKSFPASIEVPYHPLIGPSLTLTSLLMFSLVTKSLGKVKNLFPLRTKRLEQRFLNQKKLEVLLLINFLIIHGDELSIGRSSNG